jgi:hypothetical protein
MPRGGQHLSVGPVLSIRRQAGGAAQPPGLQHTALHPACRRQRHARLLQRPVRCLPPLSKPFPATTLLHAGTLLVSRLLRFLRVVAPTALLLLLPEHDSISDLAADTLNGDSRESSSSPPSPTGSGVPRQPGSQRVPAAGEIRSQWKKWVRCPALQYGPAAIRMHCG